MHGAFSCCFCAFLRFHDGFKPSPEHSSASSQSCIPALDKLDKLLAEACEGSGLAVEDISTVEIFGGSVRIPAVQARISKFFGELFPRP